MFHGKGHDPRFSPDPPEGFPDKMWLYHKFGKLRGWTPQQVDELTLDQQYWIPVMETAESIAVGQLSE